MKGIPISTQDTVLPSSVGMTVVRCDDDKQFKQVKNETTSLFFPSLLHLSPVCLKARTDKSPLKLFWMLLLTVTNWKSPVLLQKCITSSHIRVKKSSFVLQFHSQTHMQKQPTEPVTTLHPAGAQPIDQLQLWTEGWQSAESAAVDGNGCTLHTPSSPQTSLRSFPITETNKSHVRERESEQCKSRSRGAVMQKLAFSLFLFVLSRLSQTLQMPHGNLCSQLIHASMGFPERKVQWSCVQRSVLRKRHSLLDSSSHFLPHF